MGYLGCPQWGPRKGIRYSLLLGRTELVMPGGLQKDVNLGPGSPAKAPSPVPRAQPLHTI